MSGAREIISIAATGKKCKAMNITFVTTGHCGGREGEMVQLEMTGLQPALALGLISILSSSTSF